MEKSMLQKLYEDEEARRIFKNILGDLHQLSDPELSGLFSVNNEESKPDFSAVSDDMKEVYFQSKLDALINLKRGLVTGEDETKIGHWCTRDGEKAVKTMKGWPIYWLTISATGYIELDLSLWAEGKDDNTIQKGINAWLKVHFPTWEVKSLKCVQR